MIGVGCEVVVAWSGLGLRVTKTKVPPQEHRKLYDLVVVRQLGMKRQLSLFVKT